MRGKLDSLAQSFRFAGSGIWHCICKERNFRIHMTVAAYVLWLAACLGLEGIALAVLFLTISNVFAMEMLNTAVEALVDLISPQRHPLAKIAKDVAAGAVLVSAIVSVAVGISLLWKPDHLLSLAEEILTSPVQFLLLALSAGFAGWFVFGFCGGNRREP